VVFKDPRTNFEATIIIDPEVIDYIVFQEQKWASLSIESDTDPSDLYQILRDRARVSRAYSSLMLPTSELRGGDEEGEGGDGGDTSLPVFLPMIQSKFQQMTTPFLEDIHIFLTNSLLLRV